MNTVRMIQRCTAFGVPFCLVADQSGLLARMLELAPLGTRLDDAGADEAERFEIRSENDRFRLVLNGGAAAEGGNVQPLLEQFCRYLMVHVANHAPDRVFVHAGVVGCHGRALVLPGASFAGKTTLVAELVRAGAIYYSDEYAVVDERGLVHPYPRELQMRQAGRVEQRPIAVEQLHGTAGTDPLPVARVVFTEYVDAGRWRPEPLSRGMAVLEMLRHTIPVQRTPGRVMETLARMMETATAVRSRRGEAGRTAKLLLQAMSDRGISA